MVTKGINLKIIIRQVTTNDLDSCVNVESNCYTSEGATKERIAKRIETFPQGFLVAEMNGQVVGIMNSASTDLEDITDEKFKDMVGHVPAGKNIVVFSLAVLPDFQGKGISTLLMSKFIKTAKKLGKKNVLLICKENLIEYYQRYGFVLLGRSRSTHGGFEWYEMRLHI